MNVDAVAADEDWKGYIVVDLGGQALSLFKRGQRLADYRVSTAQNGPGEKQGSGCTPRGLHAIRLKIGKGCETNTVFVGRRPTGEIYGPDLERAYPERDWILTRILWLTGREQGRNRGGERDTLRRYIYIHGTPDNQPMGKPCSHGCIRMRNTDLLELFDRIEVGTQVEIRE